MSDDYEKNFWDGFFFGTLIQSPVFWIGVAIVGGFILIDTIMSDIETFLPYIVAVVLGIVSVVCISFELISLGNVYRTSEKVMVVFLIICQVTVAFMSIEICFDSQFEGRKALLLLITLIVNVLIVICVRIFIAIQNSEYCKIPLSIAMIVGIMFLFCIVLLYAHFNGIIDSKLCSYIEENYTI